MSKEMAIIALGVLVILVRTMLGLPGSWQTVLLVAAGTTIAILGFLLRGEAIGRSSSPSTRAGKATYSFIESSAPAHDNKEGINSLN